MTDRVKKVIDSRTEQSYNVCAPHLNGHNRLFGGQLMSWIDNIAAIVAMRHCNTRVITAAVDNLQFREGVKQGDLVVLVGKVTYVGKSSVEVRVDTYVENLAGERKKINKAYLVMVSVDEHGKPVVVPRLALVNDKERSEWEGGEKRSALRRQRRLEGF